MAFDIYGNHLRPGYCEVHPDVREPFPCSVCGAEYDNRIPEPDWDRIREKDEYEQWLEGNYWMDAMLETCAGLA
jgi:hypothetical protein